MESTCITALPLSQSLLSGFRVSNRVFLNLLPCACFGREKGVCDKLQRHPLIDPMFSLHLAPSPVLGEGLGVRAISIPFARENLHLVIPPQAGPSR